MAFPFLYGLVQRASVRLRATFLFPDWSCSNRSMGRSSQLLGAQSAFLFLDFGEDGAEEDFRNLRDDCVSQSFKAV